MAVDLTEGSSAPLYIMGKVVAVRTFASSLSLSLSLDVGTSREPGVRGGQTGMSL